MWCSGREVWPPATAGAPLGGEHAEHRSAVVAPPGGGAQLQREEARPGGTSTRTPGAGGSGLEAAKRPEAPKMPEAAKRRTTRAALARSAVWRSAVPAQPKAKAVATVAAVDAAAEGAVAALRHIGARGGRAVGRVPQPARPRVAQLASCRYAALLSRRRDLASGRRAFSYQNVAVQRGSCRMVA